MPRGGSFGPASATCSAGPTAELGVRPARTTRAGRTFRITRPGVDVAERSEPAGLFRLAFIRLFCGHQGCPCPTDLLGSICVRLRGVLQAHVFRPELFECTCNCRFVGTRISVTILRAKRILRIHLPANLILRKTRRLDPIVSEDGKSSRVDLPHQVGPSCPRLSVPRE